MAVYPGFIGEAYRSQSIAAAGDLLINLYPEVLESQGASSAVFYGSPGTELRYALPTKPVRGIVSLPGNGVDNCYAVAGDTLYRLNSDGTHRALGSGLPGGSSPVSIKTNGPQVAIAAGGQLWVYTSAGLKQVDPSIVAGAGTVSYSDGYFIVNVPGTVTFNISGLFDATSWNALDFGGKGGFPDLVVGQIADHRELWLFGSRTTEVWWNSGNANFPWQRIQGPFVEAGLGAVFSLQKMDNTIFWLHEDERGGRMIWKANGYTPQRVSTFALEAAMASYARVDDAIAYVYQERGHTFYVITFPSAIVPGGALWDEPGLHWDQPGAQWDQKTTTKLGATWALDAATGMWAQRDYLDPQFGLSQQVRGWVHAYAFGVHLVGDYENGNIYEQSANFYTDSYSPLDPAAVNRIRRLRRAPHLIEEHRQIFYPCLELHVQQGSVPQSGPGSVPVFNLRKSNDGGFAWSDYIEAQAGLAGQYARRLRWQPLSQSRDGVVEITSDEPIQHAWIGAYLLPDPVVGRS